MTERDKLEPYERSRSNGSAAESRVIKVADSYEILEPQEARTSALTRASCENVYQRS